MQRCPACNRFLDTPSRQRKKTLQKPLTEERAKIAAEMVKYYEEGHTIKSCAIKFDIPQTTAYNWIVASGVQMRSRSRTTDDDKWADYKHKIRKGEL